jgi:hypothetical protein
MPAVSRYGTLMRDTGRVLLLAALVAYPLLAGKSFRWQVLIMHCVVALASLLWYAGAAMSGQRPHVVRYQSLDGALLAFAVWCVVALLLAVYKYAGLVFLLALVDCLLVYWIAREGFRERRWRWAVPMALVVAGAICGLWAVREYTHTVILSGEKAWRVFGPLYNPNVLAGCRVYFYHITLVDEQRHYDSDPALNGRRLGTSLSGITSHTRVCPGHSTLNYMRRLQAQQPALIPHRVDDFAFFEPLCHFGDLLARNLHLLVVIGVHQVVYLALRVQKLHVAAIYTRPLHLHLSREGLVENLTAFHLAQTSAHHCLALARLMVLTADYLVHLTV